MHVAKIFITPDKGLPMEEVERVYAIAGKGLSGDRYAEGKGAWSKAKREVSRDVSLISTTQMRQGNSNLVTPYEPAQTRRNILLEGEDLELNTLVGLSFWLGDSLLKCVELCDPCPRPSVLAGRKGKDIHDFETGFANCGGIRARIRLGGYIKVGDILRIQPIGSDTI